MNKDSNVYIIIYSTVMVVVVAVLLAVAALSLKDRQDANILNEKKNAILASLSATDQNYDEFINAYAVNAEGEMIEGVDVFAQLQDLKGSFEQQIYPVFEAQDGRVVLPITGSGLWGPIWGYIALESDMNTVSGIVLDHQGETPGLGAEIATAAHQAMYQGKQLFEGDEFVSITLKKGGASEGNTHEVDAITGGTKTSDGVSAMIKGSVENYLPLLGAKKGAAAAEEVATEETEESNVQNVEENE